ncbi:aldose epimerase family protein [Cohnella rhizosphaerae]|uniref:DUF5107 domain-containing protein n=1 Tax=Cohnella rhizosphaerae TaxID=1457232 RepID=A0A9X4L2F0_9BACL|nr:hypothetical protein [Cohnella rhizosphaerae]MDG0812364.1 hypothetical protein [Cohnella rhizosphaerae]
METSEARIELVPGLGAKIVSLVYKPTGKEWLVQADLKELGQPAYGSSFVDADMSGWDECFPTISPAAAAGEGGRSLPDHGEVWALSWDASVSEKHVDCAVRGVAMPYGLSRRLAFSAADTVRMDYRAENLGDAPLPFLWVPHPQFAVSEPTRIVLPPSMPEMLCVYGGSSRQEGATYAWTAEADVDEKPTGDGRKFYAPGRAADGWCGLSCGRSGNWLRMVFDPQRIPYVGVWIDEGLFNVQNAVALEPSIGFYDCLDRARANGTAQTIAPGQACEWSLSVRLGAGGMR